MSDKILFVDDESPVLDGYKRMLHREFAVETAVGAELAVKTMHELGPFAVIVSDMRMPVINGTQFLANVRQISPESVRMLLTGYTDIGAAMDAVNEGNIFRFLTKPCEKEVLFKAIVAGLVQYRLVRAEHELIEKTLMGSIKVLTDVLGAASPEAFGRSMRIAHLVRHLVAKSPRPAAWRFEAAAMLSQLGCVTLAPQLIQAAYSGAKLSPDDQVRFAAHPQAARDLIVSIPRLEPIAWMISQQLTQEVVDSVPKALGDCAAGDLVFGANALKLAVAFDDLRIQGLSDGDAIASLRRRHSEFATHQVEALASVSTVGAPMELRRISSNKLKCGMILQHEVRTQAGMLVVGKGQEITPALVLKLDNFGRLGAIDKELMVLVPGGAA
jgi:FixJ family two-component response regulator